MGDDRFKERYTIIVELTAGSEELEHQLQEMAAHCHAVTLAKNLLRKPDDMEVAIPEFNDLIAGPAKIVGTEFVDDVRELVQRRIGTWHGKLLVLRDILAKNPKDEAALVMYQCLAEKIPKLVPPNILHRELSATIHEINGTISEDPGNQS